MGFAMKLHIMNGMNTQQNNLMNKCYLTVILFFTIFLYSCEKIEKEHFSYYGDVKFSVSGSDDINFNFYGYLSDVNIELKRGDKTFKIITDTLGKAILYNIPYGTYNITVSKDSFASFYQYGYQLYFADSSKSLDFHLYKKSKVNTISNIVFENVFGDYFVFFDYSGSLEGRSVFIIFWGDQYDVSFKNYQFSQTIDGYNGSASGSILNNFRGFSKIYYAIHTVNSFQSWVEPETKRKYDVYFNTEILAKGSYIVE